jgi:hypothetical protein
MSIISREGMLVKTTAAGIAIIIAAAEGLKQTATGRY